MKYFFKNLYKITRITIIILPFIVLGILIKKDLVLSGHLEFTYDFSKESPVITRLFPENRMSAINQVKENRQYWQQIEQEPVYFETRIPQSFETAEVEIVFKNENQPLIQVGLSNINDNEWNYDFKPLENQLLDKLNWFKIEDEHGTIWQKQKKFLTWEQFFDQINAIDKLAAYNFDLNRKFFIPNYQPKNQDNYLTKTLRGQHSFYTYIKDETLDFTFTIQDINRKEGPDVLTINVYNDENKKIYSKKVDDDGMISKLDPASKPRKIDLKMDGLPEGVYKIELAAEDEIFFRNIRTKQQYLTFINRVYLADSPEYSDGFVDLNYNPIIIYSTIPRLGFETSHDAGLQTVGLNNQQSLTIAETHKNYFITAQSLPAYIYSPKNDLKIFGRGLMAFSKEMYFNPEIYDLRDFLVTPDIDYIVSEYRTPQEIKKSINQEINNWKISKIKFDLSDAKVNNRKLRFAISAPELNDAGDVIPIKSIKVTLDKQFLTYKEIFNKFISYVLDKF